MAITSHHVTAFSLRLLREMDTLMQHTSGIAKSTEIPVLILGSPHDVVSLPEQVQSLFEKLGSKTKSLHWYPQSYHLLLHDVQHDEVLADLNAWLRRLKILR